MGGGNLGVVVAAVEVGEVEEEAIESHLCTLCYLSWRPLVLTSLLEVLLSQLVASSGSPPVSWLILPPQAREFCSRSVT